MKLFKKVLAAALAGAMCLAMLTGCFGGGAASNGTGAEDLINAMNTWSKYTTPEGEALKFENTLKNEAQTILNDIAAGKVQNMADGVVTSVKLTKEQSDKLTADLDGMKDKVWIKQGLKLGKDNLTIPAANTDGEIVVDLTVFALQAGSIEAQAKLLYDNEAMYTTVDGKKVPKTIGIGYRSIQGVDCYLLVTQK